METILYHRGDVSLVLMSAPRVSVSCVLASVLSEQTWTWLCLQLCSPQLSPPSRVPVCAAHAFLFLSERNDSLLAPSAWLFGELSEPSLKDSFWTRVTPRYLPGGSEGADRFGSALPSAHAACFSFAVGSRRARWKYPWLGCRVCETHPSAVPHCPSAKPTVLFDAKS